MVTDGAARAAKLGFAACYQRDARNRLDDQVVTDEGNANTKKTDITAEMAYEGFALLLKLVDGVQSALCKGGFS